MVKSPHPRRLLILSTWILRELRVLRWLKARRFERSRVFVNAVVPLVILRHIERLSAIEEVEGFQGKPGVRTRRHRHVLRAWHV